MEKKQQILKLDFEERLRKNFRQRFLGVKYYYISPQNLEEVDSKQEIEDFWIRIIEDIEIERINRFAESMGVDSRITRID